MRLRFMGWGIGWVMAFLIDCNGGDLVYIGTLSKFIDIQVAVRFLTI